jgi:chaperonin cofactor prefoldin
MQVKKKKEELELELDMVEKNIAKIMLKIKEIS